MVIYIVRVRKFQVNIGFLGKYIFLQIISFREDGCFVDGTKPTCAKFINHSDCPNVTIKDFVDLDDAQILVVLYVC